VRRHRLRHLLNRSGCCRGGRQIAGQAPAGVCRQLERGRRRRLTGQVTRPRRTVSAGLTHLRHRTWAGRTPAEILPSTGSLCSPPGRADRENGHLTIEACSRALALHAPGRPAVPVSTVTSAGTAGGSGLQHDTSTCTYAWKTLRARKGTCRQPGLNLNDGSTHTAGFQS
jgi:hypothetical protein